MHDKTLTKAINFKDHNHLNQEEQHLKNKFEDKVKIDVKTGFADISKIFNQNLQR